jgi:hypothetical protein
MPAEERQTGHRTGADMWAPNRQPDSTAAILGYFVFVAFLMFSVIASGMPITRSSVIVGLLATSLPALGAWLYIDSVAWVGPERASRIVRWAVIAVGVTFSFAGFVTAIWSFSGLAAFLVLLEIPVWYLAISGLSFLRETPDSQR